MKKNLLCLCFFLTTCLSAHASVYTDNLNRFQINLPENWQMTSSQNIVDTHALFEIHQPNMGQNQRTLIGAKTTVVKQNQPSFSFATTNESEKANIYAQTLKKASENLPQHASIEAHGFKNFGDNTFLITTIGHQQAGIAYKAITAITYFNNIQYTFYLFANANNNNVIEAFEQMLATFKVLK